VKQSTCTRCGQPITLWDRGWFHDPPTPAFHPAVPSQLAPPTSALARLRLLAASGRGLVGDVSLSDLRALLAGYDRLREYAVHPPSCRRVAGRGTCSCGLDEVLREE
jgi:hypothetical protein